MKERAIKAITFALLTMVVLSVLFSLTFPAEAQTLYERFRNILVTGNATFENHVRIEVPTAQATATPGLIIQGYGAGNPLEVRNSSGTPVYSVNSSGVSTGAGGVTNNSNLVVSAPTAIGTATPAALINNAGVSVLIDVQDGGSSVLKALNGGGVQVAAPTAIGTAVPALQVDSSGGLSNLFEIRDSATPVAAVNDGGNWIIGPADGTGVDMTWYSDTTGDTMLWDQSEEALTITGTNGQDALNIDDGNVDIADDVDVDGTTNLDAVDIDGITNLVINTEHVGVPSVATLAITYTAAAGGSGTVATVGDGEVWLVTKVLVKVTTNFDCTGDDATLVIGDGNDADGFIVLADAELQAADTEGTGFAAGWQGQAAATIGAYLDANENGFIYAPSGADETIDYLIDEVSGESLTAGAATIYIYYIRIS